ncbi:hypothetical protein JW756_03590 [Candidatus Woesearchaeota archaeon]|nr:hypothetical protein [Candidatus Woesearchaeota archaeon]
MRRLLVKGRILRGVDPNPGMKYDEPAGRYPTALDTEPSYRIMRGFLEEEGTVFMPERTQKDWGFFTEAVGCYIYQQCIVVNGFLQGNFSPSHDHHLYVVSKAEDFQGINRVYSLLKELTKFPWGDFWDDQEDKIIEVQEKEGSIENLIHGISEAFPNLPRLLQE